MAILDAILCNCNSIHSVQGIKSSSYKGTYYAGYTLCLTIDIGLVPKVHTMQATHCANYRHRAGTKGRHYAGYTLCLTIDIGLVPNAGYILCLTIDIGLVPKVHTMQATYCV